MPYKINSLAKITTWIQSRIQHRTSSFKTPMAMTLISCLALLNCDSNTGITADFKKTISQTLVPDTKEAEQTIAEIFENPLHPVSDFDLAAYQADLAEGNSQLMALEPGFIITPHDVGLSLETLPDDLEKRPRDFEILVSGYKNVVQELLGRNTVISSALSSEELDALVERTTTHLLYLHTRNANAFTLKNASSPFGLYVARNEIRKDEVAHEIGHRFSLRPYEGIGISIEETYANGFSLAWRLNRYKAALQDMGIEQHLIESAVQSFMGKEIGNLNRLYSAQALNPDKNHLLPGLVIEQFGLDFALNPSDEPRLFVFQTIQDTVTSLQARVENLTLGDIYEDEEFLYGCPDEDGQMPHPTSKVNLQNQTDVFYALLHLLDPDRPPLDPLTHAIALHLAKAYQQAAGPELDVLDPWQREICTTEVPSLPSLITAPAQPTIAWPFFAPLAFRSSEP